MQNELDIWLTSRVLYESVFAFLNKGIGSGALPRRFKLDDHARLSLVTTSFIEKVNKNTKGLNSKREAVYFDDCYSILREFSGNDLRTIWFNPGGEVVRDDLPRHDGEIRNLDEIVKIPSLLDKPRLDQCLAWWEDWDLPDNVRQHAGVVAWLAYVVGVGLHHHGIWVDPILAHRAGLVHDLDKIKTLDKSMGHGEMAGKFLESEGYPQTAEIVRGHIMGTILDPNTDERRWENKLVFFVDKLVEGDRLVPFDERLRALKARYPDYREVMTRAEAGVWALNDRICEILGIPSHEDLIAMLRESLKG